MASDDLSRQLLARIRNGDNRAAAEVFDRYVQRLLSLIRPRISTRLQRRIDADDVVQSALRSFFSRAANDVFVLQRSGDLWRLLVVIALSKLRRQVEVHTAAKRSVGSEHHPSDSKAPPVAVDHEPSPGELAALLDELTQVLRTASVAEREVLQQRLAGETIENIAQTQGRSQRTVRRLLQSDQQELERRLLQTETD